MHTRRSYFLVPVSAFVFSWTIDAHWVAGLSMTAKIADTESHQNSGTEYLLRGHSEPTEGFE